MAEKTTIARPYAQAIYDMAREQGDLKGWSEMLGVCSTIAADPAVAALIGNPNVSNAQVVQLFLDVGASRIKGDGKGMIRLLAENDRLGVLPEIAALFEEQRAASEGTLTAEVIAATKLTDAQLNKIAQALKARLGREVTLEQKIDPELLGGAIIRAGDIVIDGSVVGKLEKLSHELLH